VARRGGRVAASAVASRRGAGSAGTAYPLTGTDRSISFLLGPSLSRFVASSTIATAEAAAAPPFRVTPAAFRRLRELSLSQSDTDAEPSTTGCGADADADPPCPPRGVLLRVSVESGGCSGFAYGFAIDDVGVPEPGDAVVMCDDEALMPDNGMTDGGQTAVAERPSPRVAVSIDAVSLPFLRGCLVDYQAGAGPRAASATPVAPATLP